MKRFILNYLLFFIFCFCNSLSDRPLTGDHGELPIASLTNHGQGEKTLY